MAVIHKRDHVKLAPHHGAFGYPPGTYVSDDMVINSMPVAEIHPAEPTFTKGLTLYTLDFDKGEESYNKLLSKHGFSIPQIPLKLAFIADNFPTDTFSNEYVETFLQKTTDTGSDAFGQIVQISGKDNALEAIQEFSGQAGAAAAEFEGVFATGVGAMAEKTGKAAAGLQKMLDKGKMSESAMARFLGGGGEMINKMLSGHRVDFPQVWSNSGFTPSYSLTVRLYNPFPGNIDSTIRHIVGPIAAILCLMLPRSESAHAYRWPLYHRITVPGLYDLEPCAITNVTIIKGGDQQQIAYNQNLAMVDVRIDFQALHRSMVVEEGEGKNEKFSHRPTLRSYLDAMATQDPESYVIRSEMRRSASTRTVTENVNLQQVESKARAQRNRAQLARNQAIARRQKQVAEVRPVGSRTSPQGKVAEVEAILQQDPTTFVSELLERYGCAAVVQAHRNLGFGVAANADCSSFFAQRSS